MIRASRGPGRALQRRAGGPPGPGGALLVRADRAACLSAVLDRGVWVQSPIVRTPSPSAAARRCVFSVVFALALIAVGCGQRDPFAAPVADGGSSVQDAGAPTVDGGQPDGGDLVPLHRRDGGATRDPGASDGGPDGGFVLPPEVILVEVTSFAPNRGPAAGGTPIVIVGRGFVPGTIVTVGGQPLVGLVIDRERKLTGRTPAGPAGTVSVLIENRAARVEVPGGFVYEEPPSLTALTPSRGPASGGTAVTLEGQGFTPDMAVFIGTRAAFNVQLLSRTRAIAVTPPGEVGSASVSVLNRGGVSVRDGAFTFVSEPVFTGVEPAFGPAAGGNTVRLLGSGFDSSVRVFFGGVSAALSAITPTALDVTVPPSGAAGAVDVAVASEGGSVRRARAYTYLVVGGPLVLQAVTPSVGPAEGGTVVRLVGSGFEGGVSEVRFGGQLATDVLVESAGTVRVTTPAGAAGPVEVRLRTVDGREVALPGGYTFQPALRLDMVLPARGPSAGGTAVVLRGDGFAPGAEVFFGPAGAPSVRVVSRSELQVQTPPGPAGEVDVVVRQGERSIAFPRGFLFEEPPRLFRVSPPRGAIAGGTFIRLAGAGFTPETRVLINELPASEVRFVHGGLVTARAPRGVVGPADVLIGQPSGAALLEGGFTYFDPAARLGGTSGGPIDGSVNLTVLNGVTGRPVPMAMGTLAMDGPSLYQGVTDASGQIVFSGPDLVGRQTLTATKEGWSTYTIVAFDAQNVTVYLSPLSGSFGPGPPGVEQPKIRGTLRSAFKPIPPAPPGYKAVLFVTTSQEDRFRADYIPSASLQILYDDGRRDRPYEVQGRFGDQAVYALGGHLRDDGNEFIPYVLGLHRYISIPVGRLIVEGMDVTIDADLTATLDARLIDAPALAPGGPHVYRMRVWIDLGTDGVLTFFQKPESTSAPRLVQAKLPELTGLVAGATISIAVGAYTLTQGYETLPLSETTMDRITDLSQPIDVGPMVDLAGATHPLDGDVQADRRFGWHLRTPPEVSYFQLYLPQRVGAYNSTVWTVIVPGHLREALMPDLAAILGVGGLPVGSAADWYIVASRNRSFNIDEYDLNDFYDRQAYSFVHFTFERP